MAACASYRLLSKPSSMYAVQNPFGFALVAFLITVIFIVISYAALATSCASEIRADSKLRL